MSHPLINRDPNLCRLRDEGFELEVRSGHLLIHSVPYVNARREVKTGTLAMVLAGEASTKPPDHTAHFIGDCPCNPDGSEIIQIKNNSQTNVLASDLTVNHFFSAKPRSGAYGDYYEKVTLYVEIISGPARAINPDPAITAQTFKPISSIEQETVFNYIDTASSRAGILACTQQFVGKKLAIIGLGGTGSYVLDLVAKTPVAEIHLFDGDVVRQPNAFRLPGALSLEELEAVPKKVDHFHRIYAKLRRGIFPHPEKVDSQNVDELRAFDHVFLCVDKGSPRRLVVDTLRGTGTTIIDVGMGVQLAAETQKLWGVCRVTTLTGVRHGHAEHFIPFEDIEDDGVYSNIQIADLNCLNAALAVIRWKKLCGFYADDTGEHQAAYTTNTNIITNSEKPE
jgi:hypothetical protein